MGLKKHSCYYEDRQLEQLSAIAELDGRDVSKILRGLADQYIERNAHRLRLTRSFGGGALMKRLGGEKGEGSVVFFGVDHFAKTVEGWSAEETGSFLNGLYHEVGEVAMAHAGRVVKFMGDGGLLFFEGTEHENRAAEAALSLVGLGAALTTKHRRAISVRVGAAAGEMLIGHFGHEQFFQFDVVGDVVNVGFALLQLADGSIVVNDRIRDELADRFEFVDAGTTDIPGLMGRGGFLLTDRARAVATS